MIAEDKVAEIRERTDLLALIGEYVPLKRSGTSYKGLCPFHGEKTPSFYVHPDRGFFHCFGCQASGDAIRFLMQIEGQTFPEALRTLAGRAGIELAQEDDQADRAARQARARRERLLAILEIAAGFFVKMLDEHKFGAMALGELERRSISPETASRFRLGYAPAGWDELASHLAQRGFSPIECEQVGLTLPRKQGNGHYDRFRHRLMFPVADAQGRIVAFSGRALPPVTEERDPSREPPAKYINSPETPVYKKGELLFGLHEARVELRRRDVAIVCEGNFDVLAISQAGFANVVAPLGTAFTPAQAKLLRRYAGSVVLLFDSDGAGRKAVAAAQPLLASAGLAARVVSLPPGDDPDSFVRARGPEAITRLIEAAPGIVEHLIDAAANEAGVDAHAKAQAIEALGPVIASVDNPVEARLYVERVARAFEVKDADLIWRAFKRGNGRRASAVATTESGPATPETPRRPTPPHLELEKHLVGAFLDQPDLHRSDLAEKVQGLLTNPNLQAIFALTARWVGTRGVDATTLLAEFGDKPGREWLVRRLAIQEFADEASATKVVQQTVHLLARKHLERQRRELSAKHREAAQAGDSAGIESVMKREMERFRAAARGGTQGTKR